MLSQPRAWDVRSACSTPSVLYVGRRHRTASSPSSPGWAPIHDTTWPCWTPSRSKKNTGHRPRLGPASQSHCPVAFSKRPFLSIVLIPPVPASLRFFLLSLQAQRMDGWEDQNGTYDSLILIFSLIDDSFCCFVRSSCSFTCSTWRDRRDRTSLGDQNGAVGTSGLLIPIFSLCPFVLQLHLVHMEGWERLALSGPSEDQDSMVGTYGSLVSIFSFVDCSFFHSVRSFLQLHFLHTEGGERLGLPGPHQPWSFRSVRYVHSG